MSMALTNEDTRNTKVKITAVKSFKGQALGVRLFWYALTQ
jgi:hypothetical protein